ncbi:MAG: M6 family metalloprotease domain-containing protein [Prevotella sp.]|nr:M6 family metalloprotease domain-containing protein [Prevotella sp.]
MTRRLLTLSLLVLCCVAVTRAVPANPEPFCYTQPDGKVFQLVLCGDEHGHLFMTTDGRLATIGSDGFVSIGSQVSLKEKVRQWQKSSRHARRKASGRRAKAPSMGEARGLIVLVNFQDLAFTDTPQRISRLMNEEGYAENGATGSARDYFVDQSFGQFQPVFDVIGPVTLDHPYSYYGANLDNETEDDSNPEEMIFMAVKAAVEENLVGSLSDYDLDNDGTVDMVYVIYAGKGEADGGNADTVWPHMWDIRETRFADQTVSGLHLGLYACSAEKRRNNSYSGIGTFCHEYGHCLGLPDLYDTTYSGGFGMGSFDIMGHGNYLNSGNTPPAYSAFERYSLGWLQYEDLCENQTVELEDIKESNRACRLTSSNPDEYFTLENRQPTGWDSYLPAEGLMILHIDYDETAWEENTVNDNPDHQRVVIVPADGRLTSYSQAGDLYPGPGNNTEFTDESTPSSTLWDGSPLQKPVTGIQTTGSNVISFQFRNETSDIDLPATTTGNLPTKAYNLLGQPARNTGKGIVILNQDHRKTKVIKP